MKNAAPIALMALLIGLAPPAGAQETAAPRRQVISANPFGLILELFNAEYERAINASATLGFGGSYASFDDACIGCDPENDDQRYLNADAFFRYYPQGNVLEGWAFGVKAGITRFDSGTYPGFGFDLNRSWLLGRTDAFYVGLGFGLKRLLGDVGEDELEIIPTFRIVNIGFAF
jgi:hypothetical protein